MDTWLIALLSVLGGLLLLLVVLPLLGGVVYRLCTKKVSSSAKMEGKTVIVTGSSAGIGKQAALSMAKRGARVIMACRNQTKAQAVADKIIADSGNGNVLVRVVDLSDLTSVRKFAAQINKEEDVIHVLINNAGIILGGPKKTSAQGFELTMATNHYGTFLLTYLLVDKLKSSAPSRIVTVSSEGHKLNELKLDDLNYENRSYGNVKSYCQSKLCNVLFTKELARRLQGTGVTANCLHPGYVATDIFSDDFFGRISDIGAKTMGRTTEQGAQTTIFLAVSETVEGESGHYYDNCKKERPSGKANDMELASKLWEITYNHVGLTSEEAVI